MSIQRCITITDGDEDSVSFEANDEDDEDFPVIRVRFDEQAIYCTRADIMALADFLNIWLEETYAPESEEAPVSPAE